MNQKTAAHTASLARALGQTGRTMRAHDLAVELNRLGLTTGYGTPFGQGRGIYSHVKAVYAQLVAEGRQIDADAVAVAYTRDDGSYAYE